MSSVAEGTEEPGAVVAGPAVEVPDELRRRIARPGPEGEVIEVLAARLHHEVLRSGVEPEPRMRELLDELAPGNG